MSVVDWHAVATSLEDVCASATYRKETAQLLGKCAAIGPLTSAQRTAAHEFRRVYKFLHYNEASRLNAVVDELIAALHRRNAAPPATRNAWNYVVGSYDRWIMRARVVYVAAGLLEGTLRSRLNARVTDEYGPLWFTLPECVPSSVRNLIERESAVQSLAAIQRLIEEQGTPNDEDTARQSLQRIRDVLNTEGPKEHASSSEYVNHLTFGQLRSFFQTKRLWNKGAKLEQLFVSNGDDSGPPLKSAVDADLEIIQKIRNEVAHYRPESDTRFANALYACSRVARWLDVDLQHFYGAVDTRMSTELSILVDDREQSAAAGGAVSCAERNCPIGPPLDLVFDSAPRQRKDLHATTEGRWACQYHRIRLRQMLHRPQEE